jgi:D-3-phosphoglycerate dehydrogenase / 2-oxoglutarate reductase
MFFEKVPMFYSSEGVSRATALRSSELNDPTTKIKVLITGKIHEAGLQILRNPPSQMKPPLPLEVVYLPDCSRAELLGQVPNAHVLITRSETDVDKEVLLAGKVLSVVARAAVGYGNIDLAAATELGILVVNTPGKNTNSAAELTWALLLSMVRKVCDAHNSTSKGGWNRHHFSGTELQGKRIGIVGLGNVGHRVAQFAHGFDMEVFAYDPYLSDEVFRRYRVNRCTHLADMLSSIDVLTVHTPLNKETTHMIGAKELSALPKGSLVLNVARGGIIDENALLSAINSGHVLNAGIDTWVGEATCRIGFAFSGFGHSTHRCFN